VPEFEAREKMGVDKRGKEQLAKKTKQESKENKGYSTGGRTKRKKNTQKRTNKSVLEIAVCN